MLFNRLLRSIITLNQINLLPSQYHERFASLVERFTQLNQSLIRSERNLFGRYDRDWYCEPKLCTQCWSERRLKWKPKNWSTDTWNLYFLTFRALKINSDDRWHVTLLVHERIVVAWETSLRNVVDRPQVFNVCWIFTLAWDPNHFGLWWREVK